MGKATNKLIKLLSKKEGFTLIEHAHIQARVAIFSKLFKRSRVNSKANGCLIAVDFREKGFYLLYASIACVMPRSPSGGHLAASAL